MTYRELGRYDKAIEHYHRVVELAPEDPQYLDTLAWLLVTRAEPSPDTTSEAVRYAARACALTQYAVGETLDTLAAAQAAIGDFTSAIESSEKALALHRSRPNTTQARETQRRLELYRDGQTYRDPVPGRC